MNSKEIAIIMAYIKENSHRTIGLKEIANLVNYSEFHLSRSFKKATGFTIRQYVESVRVEKGIESLVGTDESVTDVSLDLGHKSLGTFSNTFKRQTGVSPKEFKLKSHMTYKFLEKYFKKNDILTYRDKIENTNNQLKILIQYPDDYQPKISCVGLFKEPMPKGLPVIGSSTVNQLELTFDSIPNGEYYLFACEIMENLSLSKSYVLKDNFRFKYSQPIKFEGDSHHTKSLMMRRPTVDDPPILINLPSLILKTFMQNRNL